MIQTNAKIYEDLKGILVTREEIAAAVDKLGAQITADYEGKELLLVGILKGSVVFFADLMRAIDLPCKTEFMAVSSYGAATKTSGVVNLVKDLTIDITGKHVLIVEDIIDTGRTLSEVVKILKARNPKSFRVITLLDKPSRRVVDFTADTSLFTIPDHFVIGYGLDCGEYFRNLPYIAEYGED